MIAQIPESRTPGVAEAGEVAGGEASLQRGEPLEGGAHVVLAAPDGLQAAQEARAFLRLTS